MPLTRSVVLAGTSKEETLLETVPLLISSVKKLQAQVLNLRRAANKKQKLDQRICLEATNTDIKNILHSHIGNEVDDDKPDPTCIGEDHQTVCNQADTVQPPNDPLIVVAPLPHPHQPMSTTVLPPQVPSTSVHPVLPSHRIIVIVNGVLDIFPLTFSMRRADTFTKLLCKISTICSIEYGSIEPVSHVYTFEHNGIQVSSKDTPISLGYGAVAPSANVCLTFRVLVKLSKLRDPALST